MVKINRESPKQPLVTYFGGIPLKWNRWVNLGEANAKPIWSKRSELVERLLAQKCELCGATENIEVHHIRKLKDLTANNSNCPEWKKRMSARRRKTLVLCQSCHGNIHYGRYDGSKLATRN